jgi:Tfp pilus assembly protein PilF
MRALADMAASSGGKSGGRLKSWKEVAAFFGTDERTARRWEERGLPIHRVPGGARATVYADVAELEAWLRGAGNVPPPDHAPARPKGRAVMLAAALGILVLAGTGAGLSLNLSSAAQPARHQPPQHAVDLYLAGTYDWERRTPDSLRRAIDLFGRAIAEDPDYAEAYAGLANSYLLLREYSVMPEPEAYQKARQAAERALALDPRLADAHAALAFVTFFWTRDWARGLQGFERAIALDPGCASAWHWYGTALYHAGRYGDALHALNEALRREPTSRSIVADRALVQFRAGHAGDAVATLRQLAASEPEFVSPHAYLAIIYLAQNDHAAFLAEAQTSARLRGDTQRLTILARAADGLGHGGAAMLRAMLSEELKLRRAGGSSDYTLAELHARLGERDAAMALLEAADRAGDASMDSLRADPMFDSLRDDPRFRNLAVAVERPPPGRI